VLIILGFVLLFVLPSPWNFVALGAGILLGFGELAFWNRTVRARRRVVGPQTLIGRDAVVSTPCAPDGQVRIDGELWEARCDAGAAVGDTVRIVGREGLTLLVEPVSSYGGTAEPSGSS